MGKSFDGAFTSDAIKLINSLDEVRLLSLSVSLDWPGLCCSQTSWSKFELYDLQGGLALGNRPRQAGARATAS